MHYFRPSLCSEDAFAAWDSQLAQAAEEPWLKTLSRRDLLPLFIQYYSDLRGLPRGARRDLQRKVTASREIAVPAGWKLKLAGSLAGTALLLALGQASRAATITVNTNIARIAADGKCSLVEAIINSNNDAATHADCVAGSGTDTIMLPAASAHVVPGIYDAVYGSRLPLITSAITIDGNGGKLRGSKKGGLARLLTVKNSGNLTLQNITLTGSAAFDGGAILNYGSLTIENSTISRNKAGFRGGGVLSWTNSTLNIFDSIITGNAAEDGGGVLNYGGTFTITNSVVSGNKAHVGGGLMRWNGDMTVDDCLIANNAADGGGGIQTTNFGTATVTNSTISGNRTRYDGGGIENGSGSFVLSNSIVAGNRAGSFGGGIDTLGGSYFVAQNSTISGNVSRAQGGGIFNGGGTVTLNSTTVTGNMAKVGGGIYNQNHPFTLNRTIVSGNKATVSAEIFNLPNNYATIVANNSNLFGVSGNAGVSGFSPGASDIVPAGAITTILAQLADNGGPTYTHALVPGSPAIDASPHDADCPSADQRGVSRPQGAQCDIGAFEE